MRAGRPRSRVIRNRMRAGRPRSQGNHSPLEGESQKPSRQAKADAVGGVRRATSQKAHVHPLGNSRLPGVTMSCEPGPPPCRADHSRKNGRSFVIMNHEGEAAPAVDHRMGHEETRRQTCTSSNDKRHQNASAIWCPWCDDVMG